MKKHWKAIVVIIIVVIAVGAVLIHKKIEDKSKDAYAINVTVENKVTNETLLDNFAFTAAAHNLAGFLTNNASIFNPQFNRANGNDLLTSLFSTANSSNASWYYEDSLKGNTLVKLTDTTPLNNIPIQTGSKITFVYQK